ncbi:hypothetical protein [Methylocella silvestris]|uniref:hypothetical protein n=1 Tax=Methylocella silvestris TaxID=199596 RepID=UPI0011D103D9|nr:hypothetical protein [Methylocella silvestris]
MNDSEKFSIVRTILLRDWDPIIVGDNPHLIDEYDHYIPGIIELLDRRCSAESIERHLRQIEANAMGLTPPLEQAHRAARNLVSFWNAAA